MFWRSWWFFGCLVALVSRTSQPMTETLSRASVLAVARSGKVNANTARLSLLVRLVTLVVYSPFVRLLRTGKQ
jgi:hypothetical protein